MQDVEIHSIIDRQSSRPISRGCNYLELQTVIDGPSFLKILEREWPVSNVEEENENL